MVETFKQRNLDNFRLFRFLLCGFMKLKLESKSIVRGLLLFIFIGDLKTVKYGCRFPVEESLIAICASVLPNVCPLELLKTAELVQLLMLTKCELCGDIDA